MEEVMESGVEEVIWFGQTSEAEFRTVSEWVSEWESEWGSQRGRYRAARAAKKGKRKEQSRW